MMTSCERRRNLKHNWNVWRPLLDCHVEWNQVKVFISKRPYSDNNVRLPPIKEEEEKIVCSDEISILTFSCICQPERVQKLQQTMSRMKCSWWWKSRSPAHRVCVCAWRPSLSISRCSCAGVPYRVCVKDLLRKERKEGKEKLLISESCPATVVFGRWLA